MDNQEQQPTIQPQIPVQPITQLTQTPPEPKKSFPKWPILIGGIFLILIIGAGAYLLGQKTMTKTVEKPQAVVKNPTATPTPNPTAGWKTYTNTGDIGGIGFSLKYPNSYQVIPGQQIIKRDNPQIGIPYNFLKITQAEKTNDFVLMVGVKDTSDILMPTSIAYTDKVINGMTFKQYTNNNNFMEIGKCNAYGYVIEKNNSIYNLFTCDTDTATFDKMMTTFKFTDQAPQAQPTTLKIPEYGVQIVLSDEIKDAYYINTTADKGYVYLKVHSLDTEPQCLKDDSSTAALSRVGKDDINPMSQEKYSTSYKGLSAGNYFYYIDLAQYVCAQSVSGKTKLDLVRKAFTNAAITQ